MAARVHVLTPGFKTPNGRAFLFPLLIWRRELREFGYVFEFHNAVSPAITDCDYLLIDSKYYSARWQTDGENVEKEIAALSERSAGNVIWFHTTDSSGCDQFRALPYISLWLKNQILVDKMQYMKPIYSAGRVFGNFVYKKGWAKDANPSFSDPIKDASQLKKINVGWNSGLADYSLFGPTRMWAYDKIPLAGLLSFSSKRSRPYNKRANDIACRFGTGYARHTVSWQRKRILQILASRITTGRKVNRYQYLAELDDAKITLSPFGLGEITLKDFEVFDAGSLLLKPDMSHMETWPEFFQPGVTMLAHKWDLSDLESVIDSALDDEGRSAEIATNGQNMYRKYTSAHAAPELFCEYFRSRLALAA